MTPPRRRPGNWRGLEPLSEWVKNQEPRSCACGCGGLIEVKPSHRCDGIPKFLRGHAHKHRKRLFDVERAAWREANQGKHFCHCGCGMPIKITLRHQYVGIPRFIMHHQPRGSDGAERPKPVRRSCEMSFSTIAKRQIIERCKGACARCGNGDRRVLDFDHVVPVAYGGSCAADNGQLLCCNCHRIKNLEEGTYRSTTRSARRQFQDIESRSADR